MRDAWGVGALVRWRIGVLVIWAGALVCMRPWELPRVVVGLRVGSRADQGGAWSSGLGLVAWVCGLCGAELALQGDSTAGGLG